MVKIYLTRHGETVENARGVLQGHLPGMLNEKGIEQAHCLSEELATVPFDSLIVSDLKRAVDTAVILNEPHHLDLHLTPLLRERDWGAFTGKKITTIRVKPADFPKSVENPQQLQERARQFLKFVLDNFDGQTVLAVGHGYFDRCILAEFQGKSPNEIARWGNAEVRTICLETLSDGSHPLRDSEVAAD